MLLQPGQRAQLSEYDPPTKYIVRWLIGVSLRVLVRPWLWRPASRFLCWPPSGMWPYMRFRYITAYGNSKGDSKDIIPFLWWSRRFPG